jgi:Transposase DDE domain
MPHTFNPKKNQKPAPFENLFVPVDLLAPAIPQLETRGYRPLQMTFMQQLKALVLFHLEEHSSGRHLLQFLEEDDFARKAIAPPKGIKKSAFFEAINTRGLEQLFFVFKQLQAEASKVIPKEFDDLGDLIAIDGSYINVVLSMHWADFSDEVKKAKAHLAFDLNRSIPAAIVLTDGKVDERPYVNQLLSPGQTGVMDRNYQCYKDFDQWQTDGKHFVCRIRGDHRKTIIASNPVQEGSIVFYDAVVLLGTRGVNQTEKQLRVVGYRIDNKPYWIATDRHDLCAEQIAAIYKARWAIEKFFGWWKRHLRVYHILARSRYGLTVQILAGLIAYLLLAIYFHKEHGERVSIKRVRQLRIEIRNSLTGNQTAHVSSDVFKEQGVNPSLAKT